MGITEKCAYIKGLMEGLEIDTSSKEGKVLAAIVDLLGEVCEDVKTLDENQDQIYDQLDQIDEDLDELADTVYDDDEDGEEDEEENEDDAQYELTCPKCGAVTVVDIDTLMDENSEIHCEECGALFDIQLQDDEEPQE